MGDFGNGLEVGSVYMLDDGNNGVMQVMQTQNGPVRVDYGHQGDGAYAPTAYYQNVTIPNASQGGWRQVTQQEALSPTFAPTATTYEQIAPSIRSSFGPSPAQQQADANAARMAQLAQFAGGALNRGPIGVPQVALGGNYGPMYSMPNAGAQPFSFINPGSGGLLGNAMGNGSMGSAQPFGGPIGGGLLGGAK